MNIFHQCASARMMKRELWVCVILLFFAPSCKKKQPMLTEEKPVNTVIMRGLPADQRKINGYLYASNLLYKSNDNYFYLPMRRFASFCDPGKDLMRGYNHRSDQIVFPFKPEMHGNVEVGAVVMDSLELNKTMNANTVSYTWQFNSGHGITLLSAPKWELEGNKTFEKQHIAIPMGFPVIKMSNTPFSFSKSSGLSIPLNGFEAYDSLLVVITNSFPSYNFTANKVVLGGADSVHFSHADLSVIPVGSQVCSIEYFAYNYHHQTINNKLFVYELRTNSAMQSLQVNP
jgi:hypothetical protein